MLGASFPALVVRRLYLADFPLFAAAFAKGSGK